MGQVIDWAEARWSARGRRAPTLACSGLGASTTALAQRRAHPINDDRAQDLIAAAQRWLAETDARSAAWRDQLTLIAPDAALIERFESLAQCLRRTRG